MQKLKLIECPRDAMQGIKNFIPTDKKVEYINQILKVGFDTVDFGSFVNPKAIPQMADTSKVITQLDLSSTSSKLLSIIANKRGAEESAAFDEITYLGYPFSVSETFQLRNTNATVDESMIRVEEIQKICFAKNKKLVVYIYMGFGKPYGDAWSGELVANWCDRLHRELDVKIMAISDTIGVSNDKNIRELFSTLIPALPNVEFGAHLHTTPDTYAEKIKAAVESGCYRFDGAIKGYGGCPMAEDTLTGNMPTERMIDWFENNGYSTQLDKEAFDKALEISNGVFLHLA
jgi:hydroxymethylglutaryl-CoA lyase